MTLKIFILLITSFSVNGQQKGYEIEGKFEGLTNGIQVYLFNQDKDTINKTISHEDNFNLKGVLAHEGCFLFIAFDSSISKKISKAIFVTNNKITITGKIGDPNIKVSGSLLQDEYNLLQEYWNSALVPSKKIMKELSNLQKELNTATNQSDSINAYRIKSEMELALKEDEKAQNEFDIAMEKWIINRKNSLLTPYVVQKSFPGYKEIERKRKLWKLFPDEVKNSHYGILLLKDLENSEFSQNIAIGNKIPSFNLSNENGDEVNIYSIIKKNKLTLIDCWASWCSPCREATPKLKKALDSFQNKGFGIVGISLDKSKLFWKKAIKEDQSNWPHFIQDNAKSISKIFDLSAIPAYILVDRDGNMLAFNSGMSRIADFGGDIQNNLPEIISKNL